MTTRLGIGTYAFAWSIGVPGYPASSQPMDHTRFLQTAADLGASLVQIADNLPLDALTDEEQHSLAKTATDLGLAVEVGTRGIQPDHLRKYMQIANRFGSPILRVVVDTATHHPDVPEIIQIVGDMLPEFESAGITLAIENHDRFRASQLVEIMAALNSDYVGICLDTVNSFGALEGPRVVVEALGPYVVNLHVKDFEIHRVDHNMGFVLGGTPAGAGMLDVPWLLESLNTYGQTYNAILELWPAPESTMDATAAKELEWAKQSMANLRQWIKD